MEGEYGMKEFDVVIIGAGPGGLSLAYQLKAQGKSVAVVEENLWGGTCPNRGCDPKKVLLAAVEAKQHNDYMVGSGIEKSSAINWNELMQFEKTFTKDVSPSSRQGLVDSDVTVYDGHASFIDQHQLQIDDQIISSKKYVIATGQRPSRLDIKGQEYLKTSTDFLKMDKLPKTIALIGGGYIGFEFAAIASAAGADVHLIHHNDRPLKEFPVDGVQSLIQQLQKNGVHFNLNVDITDVALRDKQFRLSDDGDFNLDVDAVFVTAGRQANDDTLNLNQIGVKTDRGGIVVNDHLQTDVENIYALGDVISKRHPKLTPVSGFEAKYLSKELNGGDEPIDYPVIPTVIYGMPKLAQVGISIETAEQNPEQFNITKLDMKNWFSYRRIKEPVAEAEIIHEKSTNRIVGGYVVSSEADTLINYLTMIINKQMTMDDITNEVYAYPTEASDLEYL